MNMDYTTLFWFATIAFVVLSAILISQQRSNRMLYAQVATGLLIFAFSKIGRQFIGLE
jgi:glucose dehydrogenase